MSVGEGEPIQLSALINNYRTQVPKSGSMVEWSDGVE